MPDLPANLYVHFPFCRTECSYCALYSRCGVSAVARDEYVQHLADALKDLLLDSSRRFTTIYFGGGSPALCDLRPLFRVLEGRLAANAEFTVELHPLDVTNELLSTLRAGGVTRLSMGVQSLNDRTLAAMGRGYTVVEAAQAFARIRTQFDNAGIDLIVGFPGDPCTGFDALASWGLRHCSVYALQNERGLKDVPSDDFQLDVIRTIGATLASMGLPRYEISNYAQTGFECRHNFAVWRGEDYWGLGEGACGRVGRLRTRNFGTPKATEETVDASFDERERRLFRLRTREGLSDAGHPEWTPILASFCAEGLLTHEDAVYRLTPRGTEVCDTILSALV